MKWSTVLEVVSIGMRTTADHATPSDDVLSTMSLAVQPERKRQSCQTTYTLPAPSISADGSGPLRRLPATVWSVTLATSTAALQDLPPLVERKAPMAVSLPLAKGTITVPLGCTTGWPPRPCGLPRGAILR